MIKNIKGIKLNKILLIVLMFVVVGCNASNKESSSITIIHVTDAGGIDDNSFNALAWLGVTRFYANNNLTHKKNKILSPNLTYSIKGSTPQY